MVSVADIPGGGSPLNATLRAGVRVLSQNQTITFTKYVRAVLPFDGFVFWVRADLLSASALANAGQANSATANEPATIITPAPTITQQGSLHYSTAVQQNEDETLAINHVIFSTFEQIDAFNQVGPECMFIGTIDGLQFTFSRRGNFYRVANEYHYEGDAVYPALATQIVDNVAAFDTQNLVVSNSLPAWLGLTQFCPVYPSFLVPENATAPYIVVHIPEEATATLQPIPRISKRHGSHYQLAADQVRMTLYGMRNFAALDFVDYMLDYIRMNDGVVGLMSGPTVADSKRTQVELATIAQKKVITFRASYYQTRINDVARQTIKRVIPQIILSDYAQPVLVGPTPIKPVKFGTYGLDFSKAKNSMYAGVI